MARCFYIRESGARCVSEADEATGLCDAHQKVIPFKRPEDSRHRKVFVRLVAFLLLITLLIPLLYSFRSLYWHPSGEAQKAW